MRFSPIFLVVLSFAWAVPAQAADPPVSRRDAFVLIWRSTSRPAENSREKPYSDVSSGSDGFLEITYAKARGLLSDDQESFYPDAPASPSDALRWIFRTRSVEGIDADGSRILAELAEADDVPALAEHYGISYDSNGSSMTREELLTLMQQVDGALRKEEHEASLYSEKFHGKGTAFGETFDMHAMTAAHRTFPHNTLVKVTNLDNGKSVVVRINDRGPYVQGRDIDLSLGAFTTIAERSKGKIMVTFERLGDVNVVNRCQDDRFQRRITRDVILNPGVPHSFALGSTMRLSSEAAFVLRDVIYPDGTRTGTQDWVTPSETFALTPSMTGLYRFLMGTKEGRIREMRTEVVNCN